LWLLTLSRGQTFTFLDHCLKAGDSLVGLNKAQILRLDWSDSSASATEGSAKKTAKQASKAASKKTSTKRRDSEQPQIDLFADQTLRAFAKATLARQRLAALARTSDSDDTERRQHDLHVDAERALERLRDVADILLSTYFFPYERPETLTPEFLFRGEKVSDKDRKNCLGRVRDELNFWLMRADSPPLPKALELRRSLIRDNIRPMHWELEFPEVFSDERSDPLMEDGVGKAWVDAVVGNPPFSGQERDFRRQWPILYGLADLGLPAEPRKFGPVGILLQACRLVTRGARDPGIDRHQHHREGRYAYDRAAAVGCCRRADL
jgi:hypothetical protein